MEGGHDLDIDGLITVSSEAHLPVLTEEEYWKKAQQEGRIAVNGGHVSQLEQALDEEGKLLLGATKVKVGDDFGAYALIKPDEFVALIKHMPPETALNTLYDEIGTPFTSYLGRRQQLERLPLQDTKRHSLMSLVENLETRCRFQCATIENTIKSIQAGYANNPTVLQDTLRVSDRLNQYRGKLPMPQKPH